MKIKLNKIKIDKGTQIREKINHQTGLGFEVAKRYYCFRLRRMCEMICQAKNPCVFVEGISDGTKIFDHFNKNYKLFPPLDLKINYEKDTQGIPEECFERYYSFLIKMRRHQTIANKKFTKTKIGRAHV